jgi:hypothetical protein
LKEKNGMNFEQQPQDPELEVKESPKAKERDGAS